MFKDDNPAKDIKVADTIIGSSVKVEGDFISDHDIIIDGQVIGNIKTKNNLKIGISAVVKAEITAKNAYISGSVTGNINIMEKLYLTEKSVIKGNVKATVLTIEQGAKFNGQCQMVDLNAPVVEEKKK
ncbi:MAG: cell shape determination protein CcmA [Candidatus Komeilibacteria bacterium CG_4_10_14_0_2_um_filter_37_10]|uniref:Cell shape determination protein CcmA n=1 Tax=Candidatus Komeilibacteria bacterium CG_4_10_14_0_2_um_filter_37_10 TaxID=1974470 RepID=A0A2M7VD88_9BACT|nr:MAG: cell shape determination protein CcmA [Candidatus Komeilibacteria bacterium CG_4_10_14_0_2_um_filter_37_10]